MDFEGPSGAMCEAKMVEVVALWYICIIKSVSGLLKVLVVCLLTFSSTDSACTKALGHYFITFLNRKGGRICCLDNF